MASRRLSTQILRWQLAILVGTLLVGFGLTVLQVRSLLVHQYEERALAIAQAVQVEPGVADAVVAKDPDGFVQRRAEAIRKNTGALFVVVTDNRGIRYSHPNPDELGHEVSTSPDEALAGQTVLAVQRGTLGLSARAKVPLRTADGAIVGEVSVGIGADEVDSRLLSLLPSVALYLGLALLVGVTASLLLARKLKRQTFGLELGQIAGLLQEREATLYGIREGVVAADPQGTVTLVNDEARALLGLTTVGVGQPLADLVPTGRLADVLTGRQPGSDQVVVTERHCLVVNRRPVMFQGRDLGAVITLSDRTEQESLLRELDSVRGLTDALRAQQHEFDNRVHALGGLIELGHYEEASRYVGELSSRASGLAERLQERIASPQVVGLLVAKSVVAAERGVTLSISDDSALDEDGADPAALLTIIGNLVDNAIDAAAGGADPAVQVAIRAVPGRGVTVQVRDNGPGIAQADRARIFVDGFTTKPQTSVRGRGLGLALVQRTVTGAGGSIAVGENPASHGALFTVVLPYPAHASSRVLS